MSEKTSVPRSAVEECRVESYGSFPVPGLVSTPTPEEAVRAALLRVARNVAKHMVGRSGWHPGDECFEVDLRAAEAELLAAIREAERAAALAMRERIADWLERDPDPALGTRLANEVRALEVP